MGLRELKAARTRQTLTDVALDLFLRHGYDQTTMEQVAEHADVGTTTLYRYFPTKDQLLLDPLVEAIDPTPHLRDRPFDEAVATTLGAALLSVADTLDESDARISQIRRLVDAAPSVRAKLWDRFRTLRDDLELVVAERMGLPATDLSVRATAGLTLDVFQMIDRRAGDPRTHREIVLELLGALPHSTIVFPAAPAT